MDSCADEAQRFNLGLPLPHDDVPGAADGDGDGQNLPAAFASVMINGERVQVPISVLLALMQRATTEDDDDDDDDDDRDDELPEDGGRAGGAGGGAGPSAAAALGAGGAHEEIEEGQYGEDDDAGPQVDGLVPEVQEAGERADLGPELQSVATPPEEGHCHQA